MPVTSPQGTLDFKKVDKITFVGASSNTVIDTTTGSVGIGVDGNGPTSNLHVVGHTRLEGDINMLHTSNTASIKLNSNVVTEFPRSKKLIKYPRVAIASGQSGLNTGYTQDNYKIQVSTEWTNASSYAATNAFDNKFILDSWLSGQDTYSTDGTAENATSPDVFQDIKGSWINIQLPDRIVLDHFTITNRISSSIRNGNTGILWAKNKTDSTWFRIHDFSGLNTASSATNTIHTNQTIAYDEYRLQITKIEPYNGIAGLSIGEWQLFGVPEYDPEAHGTDVVVKSVANVPNTDWLEVYYDAKGLTDISSGVSDLSGNSINGVVTGATLGTDENIDIFNFDGQNDIIQGTFSGHTLSSGYTMATWIKPGDIGADDYIATFGVGSNGTAFGINFQTVEGAFRAFIWGSTTPGIVAQTNDGVVTKNKWVHVAATFISEDGTIHLYIDNKLTATGTGTALSSISASAPLVLGARNSGGTIQRHANFKMANFRLFNRTLTSDEIYQLYAYQKKDFGHGDLSMTLKAGRLGIGTSEPKAALDVRGTINATRFNTLVAEQTVTSTVDSVEFTGLDLIGDGGTYKILWKVRNPVAGNPQYYMTVNGDATITNYYYGGKQHTNAQFIADGNFPTIFPAGSASTHTLEITMTRSCDGYIVAHGQGNFHTGNTLDSGSVQGWELSRWFYKIPGNVTSILFSSANSSTGKYGTGSNIQIHKYM